MRVSVRIRGDKQTGEHEQIDRKPEGDYETETTTDKKIGGPRGTKGTEEDMDVWRILWEATSPLPYLKM